MIRRKDEQLQDLRLKISKFEAHQEALNIDVEQMQAMTAELEGVRGELLERDKVRLNQYSSIPMP